jgi:DNA invertase Pin-like site-specific DNA recombinase
MRTKTGGSRFPSKRRVRSGLRSAKAKGKRLGRQRKSVDVARINALRESAHSWRTIAGMMNLSVGKAYEVAHTQQKTPDPNFLCA